MTPTATPTVALRAEHPQSIGGVLDSTFRLFFATFRAAWPLALISMLVWIPAGVVSAWGLISGTIGSLPELALSWRLWGSLLAALLIAIWCYAAQLWRMHAIVAGAPVSLVAGLLQSLSRLPGIVLASIVYLLLLFAAVLLAGVVAGALAPASILGRVVLVAVLLVPAVAAYVAFYFYLCAIVVDGSGPFAGLGKSYFLVRGNWWRAAALLTVGMILWSVLYFAISLVGNLLSFFVSDLLWNLIVSQTAVLLLSSLIMPFLPALSLAVYYDLKLRREGTDLLARVESVGAA